MVAAKQGEKKCCILQREKEQLQTEHSKAVLSRSRLESLCRELQRQNKAIKEESLQKVREEEEKRKEVSTKFQGTLNEITTLMQQNIEKNSKLKEENVEMAQRFGKLVEQYEIREQQVEKLVEQIHIETELGEARIAKARMEMASERETMLREKQALLLELEECRGEIRGLQENDLRLRGQLNLYTDKYDEFKTALTRSSEVFNGFKGEMEKMSKKICKLEKETTSWKQRWECSHQALLEMAADKQQRDGELALANRRLTQMQALCRTLQAERSALLAQVRGGSEGVKVADKADDSIKVLDEPKGLEEIGSKESEELSGAANSKLSNQSVGVSAESSKDESTLSSANIVNEVKEGNDICAMPKNENPGLQTPGLSMEVMDGISQSAVVVADDSAKNSVSQSNSLDVGKGEESCDKESFNKDAVEKSDSDAIVDSKLPKVPFTGIVNECKSANKELLGESPVKVDNSSDELLLLPSPSDSGDSKEVGSTEFGAQKESIIEELNSLKQKLDSCIISDVRPSIIEESQKITVGDPASNKLEECKPQLEAAQHLEMSFPAEVNCVQSENKCNSMPAAEPVVKELQCENICDNSSGSNTADMKTLSLDTCDKSGTIILTDEVALEKKFEENIGVGFSIVADTTRSAGEGNAVNSPEKCKSELEVTSCEKPIIKNSAPNGAKKPDAQVNPKKGKESSRKRKR
ncbi:beta-taxilin-like isoform X2 [Hetaerina americana]|uniref:beta-taxilin-like isoform X2 n=1 Tax=Hetaerina americana TaxID=62018 RepID=UPI003A7F14E1